MREKPTHCMEEVRGFMPQCGRVHYWMWSINQVNALRAYLFIFIAAPISMSTKSPKYLVHSNTYRIEFVFLNSPITSYVSIFPLDNPCFVFRFRRRAACLLIHPQIMHVPALVYSFAIPAQLVKKAFQAR